MAKNLFRIRKEYVMISTPFAITVIVIFANVSWLYYAVIIAGVFAALAMSLLISMAHVTDRKNHNGHRAIAAVIGPVRLGRLVAKGISMLIENGDLPDETTEKLNKACIVKSNRNTLCQ